jgi:hypothetical protein
MAELDDARGGTEIEPDGLGYHLGWDPMTVIEVTGNLTHAVRIARNPTTPST